jgi:hypothetical protein
MKKQSITTQKQVSKYNSKRLMILFLMVAAMVCMAVACDPGCHDEFYLKNNTDTPITYSQFNTNDSTQRNVVTIQPGESKRVYEYVGRDSQFESITTSLYCDELLIPANNYCHQVTFSDGTIWQWDLSDQITADKHPYLMKCWNILSATDTKHRHDHQVEYVVDAVDYRNALQRVTGNR